MLKRISEKKVFLCVFSRSFCYFVWSVSIILTIPKQSLLLGYTTADHCARCRNTGYLWFAFFRIWTELYFPVFGRNCGFWPNTRKYRYNSDHICGNGLKKACNLGYFTQWITIGDYLWNKGKPCKIMYNG